VAALEDQSSFGSNYPAIGSPEELDAFFAEIVKSGPTKPRKLTLEETRRNEELDAWCQKEYAK
jgi:hypothetical protein